MKKVFISLAFVLVATSALTAQRVVAGASHQSAPISSGFDYWPQTDGDSIQYNIYTSSNATYDTSTGFVKWGSVNYLGNGIITTSFFDDTGFASYSHAPSIPGTPLVMSSTQIHSAGLYNRVCLWGESMNEVGNPIYPPEPKITCNPVVGETFNMSSVILVSRTDHTVAVDNFPVTYRTIGHYTNYGAFTDVWLTSLIEKYGTTWRVYNYAFARNVGLVIFVSGAVGPGNSVNAITIGYKNP